MRAWQVFRKELLDALRDRKTLTAVLISSLIVGPLMMGVLSTVITRLEQDAEARELYAVGLGHAPALANCIARQGYTVKAPPADYEARLQSGHFRHPVLVVPDDFDTRVEALDEPQVTLVTDSSNQQANNGTRNAERLVSGCAREQGRLNLMVRGVSPQWLQPFEVQSKDLATAASRSSQLTTMIPFIVMMALLYGALNAALDTTAGERERGSLEPLLTNPVERLHLVLGKWGAVAALGIGVAVLSVLSIFPSKLLIRSEMMEAMFQFGPEQGAVFIALLAPFAATLAAALMAVAIRGKTFKEAQASATFVVLAINMLPLVTVFDPTGPKPWHLWVPGLGQQVVLNRVLKGEHLGLDHLLFPTLTCLAITVVCLWWVSRSLHKLAAK